MSTCYHGWNSAFDEVTRSGVEQRTEWSRGKVIVGLYCFVLLIRRLLKDLFGVFLVLRGNNQRRKFKNTKETGKC